MPTDTALLDKLLHLPPEDQLSIIEALWDSLSKQPTSVPLPDWHRDLLDQRIEEDEADDGLGESWKDLRRRIETRR